MIEGTQYSNADTLSRRPSDHPEITTVEAGTSLTDPEFLTKAQMKDSQLITLKLHLQKGTVLHDGPPGLCKSLYTMDLFVGHTKILLHS